MKLHLFHFTPHGLARAFSHMVAGHRLCKSARTSLRRFVPDSVNSMTTAWNYKRTLQESGMPAPQTILDVCANVSQMTRLLLLCGCQDARVISFEPNPALQPVGEVHRVALLDRDGTVPFNVPDDNGWGSVAAVQGDKSFQVRAARFETLVKLGEVEWERLSRPLLVKIDTEGAEKQVIDGFGDHLGQVDQLLIEVANQDDRGQQYNLLTLCTHLAKYGFRNAKILYACYDGPSAPAYADVLFWK